MATLYDEKGTEIYAGRGKYSRHARRMIEQRAAYKRNEDGQLMVYVPKQETPTPQLLMKIHVHSSAMLNDWANNSGLDLMRLRFDEKLPMQYLLLISNKCQLQF